MMRVCFPSCHPLVARMMRVCFPFCYSDAGLAVR